MQMLRSICKQTPEFHYTSWLSWRMGEKDCVGFSLWGDGVHIRVDIKGQLIGGILMLISSYYVFDCHYPRPYSMIMATLQTVVIEEPYKQPTTKKFNLHIPKLRQAMSDVQNASHQ